MTETNSSASLDAAAYTTAGKQSDRVSLPGDLFDGTVNMPVMHQAVKAFLANRRLGLAATKTRGFVIGGNRKPWKQKGTGRARAGSTRAPTFVGGGTVFGPTPRSYAQSMPKKMRALARKSALNARAREDAVIVVEAFDYEKPSTKQMISLLGAIGAAGKKVLVLTDGSKINVYLSGRNIARAHVMPYSDVSTYHILWSDVVVIEAGALGSDVASSDDDGADDGEEVKAKSGAGSAKRGSAAKKSAKSGAAKAKKTAAKKSAKAAKSPKKTAKKTSSAKKTSGKKKGKSK